MPCLLLVLVLAFPRVVMVAMFLFTTYLERAYHGILLPALGFVFLPLTTLVYAWLHNSHRPIDGVNALILVMAVVVDAGGLGDGARRRWHD
jgi:UDP-N-acetylmuramyl pentapeptide phosphotransferase/UDP-N-acetylglucosamine-1-phosphate transferase